MEGGDGDTGGYYAENRTDVRAWIHDLVRENGKALDPAEMVELVGNRYDLEEEEEEDDGGGGGGGGDGGIDTSVVVDGEGLDTIMEGDDEELASVATTPTSSTSATVPIANDGNDRGNPRVRSPDAVPELVRRRQIVLQWLESCHDRAVVGYHPQHHGGIEKKVMWKDTIEALKRQARGGSRPRTNKITEFHPDAPLLLLQQVLRQTQNKTRQRAPPSSFLFHDEAKTSSSSHVVEPLYGNDDATERYLLSTCLSLLKAGRFPEALDMCRDYGRHWRAASWGGNAACGRRPHYDEDDDDHPAGEETKDEGIPTVRVGNPKRALWKRTTWNGGRALHARLSRPSDRGDGNTDRAPTVHAGGSLVYEAAIASVLADDVHAASRNPTLDKTWLDLAWVYYRGIQARFMEQVYHAHNDVRRETRDGDMALFTREGTECETSEIDQLDATEGLERLEEETFLAELKGRFDGGTEATEEEEEEDGSKLWRDCMTSFLVGMREVERFVRQASDAIFEKAGEGGGGIRGNRDESILRFVLHLLLFLETLSSVDDDGGADESSEEYLAYFRDEVVRPRRDALLVVYVRYLSTQKSLWHLMALYVSLLEEEVTVEMCSEFWLECVVEDVDRRMVLDRAREFFDDGLDLVILRGVVRSCIDEEDDGVESGCMESSRPFPSSWLHFTDKNSDGDDSSLFVPDTNLEERILSADVWKMHSIHWLCYYREHAADALICTNLLLRKLLRETIVSNGDDNVTAKANWLGNVKLYTAKVFVFRVLHSDIFDEVMSQCQPTVGTTTTRLEDDDGMDEESPQYPGSPSSISFVRDNVSEHCAIVSYLQAHDAYLEWMNVVRSVSVPDLGGGNDRSHPPDSLEHEIANKMKRKIYVDKKRHVAHAVIKAAEDARVCFMEVLTYEGGWLEARVAADSPHDESACTPVEDECAQRLEEMKELRSMYLPNALFLLFQVLDETAKWMEEFARETICEFGREEGSLILARISGIDLVESGGNGNDQNKDDASLSPFSPGMWYHTALLLANTVANNEYDISSCLSQDDLKLFMNYMVDSTVSLLRFQEQTRTD